MYGTPGRCTHHGRSGRRTLRTPPAAKFFVHVSYGRGAWECALRAIGLTLTGLLFVLSGLCLLGRSGRVEYL